MSKTHRSRRRLVAPTIPVAAPERLPVAYGLCDLAVAPENLRYAAPADEGIGELAETILAAGVLQPLTVRPGRGAEKPAMVLDGRRRLLALQALAEAGRIAADHPVSCFVETDRARQAAAAVLTNTGVPVHVADVIVAIGKMLQARLSVPAIAGALGYGELEVRRLAALSALHPRALEALKTGRCSLRQARLLARLPDPEIQAGIAEAALNGFGFQEWRVTERLEAGQVSIHDRRFAFVGRARYAEAGGRLESDLFGERADVVLDPDRLQVAWAARAESVAQAVAGDRGWQVVVAVDEADIEHADLEPFGDAYGIGLEGEPLTAWRSAQDAAETARQALAGQDLAEDTAEAEICAFLAARVAADLAGEPERTAQLVTVFADAATGLDVRLWGPPAPEVETPPVESETPDDGAGDVAGSRAEPVPLRPPARPEPVAAAPAAEVQGLNHALHELRTDVATRALIRALADDPAAALVAVVARLFSVLVLRQGLGRGGALSLMAEPYGRLRSPPIAPLDGEVRRRLADRREAWAASGRTPIAWVAGLAAEARLALLAELAALSLDLREERTTAVRWDARAEAVEIAALCGADVGRHWTPDPAFLGAHPKARLLAMLGEMGADEPLAAGARKDELVALVAERAAERGWAPAFLNWAAAPSEGAAPTADDPASEGADTEVGGAQVDPDGEADPPPTA
jgi:ParB family chromosome partitioning protein